MDYGDVAEALVQKCREIFEKELSGVYLHGSMAMGCFNPEKSDIDVIVVIKSDASDFRKLRFMEEIVELNAKAPPKGIEISIVKEQYCKPFVYPTPYELHFSPGHLERYRRSPEAYVREMKGTDKDLAAHFTVINNYGRVLWGKKIGEVFGQVPREDYIDSIFYDIENAVIDLAGDPVYVTLNLCRTLCFLCNGKCVSKAEGGRWAIGRSEFDSGLINEALDCYLSDKRFEYNLDKLQSFARKMLKTIKDMLKT